MEVAQCTGSMIDWELLGGLQGFEAHSDAFSRGHGQIALLIGLFHASIFLHQK